MSRWARRSTSAGPRPTGLKPRPSSGSAWPWLAGLAFALWVGLWLLCTVFGVLLLSLSTAWLLDPMVDEWEGAGRRRDVGILLIFGSFFLLIGSLIVFFFPWFLQEMSLASDRFASYLESAPERLGPWVHQLEDWLGVRFLAQDGGAGQVTTVQPGQILFAIFPFAISGTMGLVVFLMNCLLFPVFCFYMLRDWDLMIAWFEDLVPPRNLPRARRLGRAVDEKISAFVWGQLIVASALGFLYFSGLWLIGVDVALVVGVVSGLLSMVPYLGLLVGVALAAGASALQFGWDWHIGGVFVVFGVAQTIEAILITPKVMGEKVGLHPLVIMIVLIAGGSLYSFWGMILAIPVAAAGQVLLGDWVRTYRASRYYRSA